MTSRSGRILLVLLLCCLLAVATSAFAECAWVLWEVQASEKRGRMFLFDHAFASRGECEETRTVWIKIAAKENASKPLASSRTTVCGILMSASPTPWTRVGQGGGAACQADPTLEAIPSKLEKS